MLNTVLAVAGIWVGIFGFGLVLGLIIVAVERVKR